MPSAPSERCYLVLVADLVLMPKELTIPGSFPWHALTRPASLWPIPCESGIWATGLLLVVARMPSAPSERCYLVLVADLVLMPKEPVSLLTRILN
jgi:hypothetical protein